jgi:hypothetical protein
MDADALYPSIKPHPHSIGRSRDFRQFIDPLRRTEAHVKYYFIDFGISTRFLEGETHLVTGIHGRDQDVPELSNTVPYDPFKVDVFILGNTYKKRLVEVRSLDAALISTEKPPGIPKSLHPSTSNH